MWSRIRLKGYICGDYVRFRTGPSSSYSIIDSYNRGTPLSITGVSGDWTKCVIAGQEGFLLAVCDPCRRQQCR